MAYVGNTKRNVNRNIPINSLTPAQLIDPANLDPTQNNTQRKPDDFLRPYLGYGKINERRYSRKADLPLHPGQVSRRMSNGFAGSVAYTGRARSGSQGWDWYRTDADNLTRFTPAAGAGRTTCPSTTTT